MKHIFFAALFILCGCTGHHLTVYTRYDTAQRLASSHVGTPDPRRLDPNTQGETLILHWIVPKNSNCWVEITRVYRTGKRDIDAFYLPSVSGCFEIPLRGCEYIERGGYLSYQVILFQNGEALRVATHPLYVEPILTRRETEEDEDDEELEDEEEDDG